MLAIRGTNDVHDIATDVISVAALGSTRSQGQYQSLRTKVQEWVASGVLPARFAVTGHSLGGFLATGLALEFPQLVEHAYLYNAPGVGGLTGRTSIAEIARAYHISGATVDPTKFTSLRAKPGTSLIAGLGEQPSAPILVEGEDHGGWLVGTENHSMKFLVDALAIHDAFDRLGNGAGDAFASIGRILRGSSGRELGKLEGALDALRTTVLGGVPARTPEENRDALYENLYALTGSSAYANLVSRADLKAIAALGHEAIASDPSGSLGSLIALRWLAPFRLDGVDAQLAAAHPDLQASLAHDAALSAARKQVDAHYSEAWRGERARLLAYAVARNEADAGLERIRRAPVGRSFADLDTGTIIEQNPLRASVGPLVRTVFGKDSAANSIIGGPGTDLLFGGRVSDTLDGGTGNDYLEGGRGDDVLRGGTDADRVVGGEGADQLFGDDGDDRLLGGDGIDVAEGGAGDDRLDGGLAADQLRGGTGYDAYTIRSGEGKDTITDTDGRGRIDFVDGADRRLSITGVGIADRAAANRWSVLLGSGVEVVATRNSPLTLTTPDGTQVVVDDERAGALGITLLPDIADQATTNTITGDRNADKRDALAGTSANDLIDGGADTDSVLAGAGADRVKGGAGRDRLDGEAGDDILEGGTEGDILEGGAGRDRLFADAASTLDPLAAIRAALASTGSPTGSQGDWLSGNDDADILIGGLGNDGLAGGQGTDVLVGGLGDDSLLGDADIAPATGTWGFSDTDVNGVLTRAYTGMDGGSLDPAGGGNDSLYGGAGADFAWGGRGDDAIFGESGNDFLQGDAGADTLAGGDGADRLAGDGSATTSGTDQGNDALDGGAGDDVLTGGGASDDLIGGDGNDMLIGDDASDRVPVAFHGADRLDGGAGDDALSGGFGSDELLGGSGNDSIAGDLAGVAGGDDDEIDAGDGDDIVDAGGGNDRVAGGAGLDRIDGGDGHDEIAGGAGDDILVGSAGDDLLDGGLDDDLLFGGDGLDALDGGEGDDSLSGDLGDDELLGASGDDDVHGGAGDDRLSGEEGEDYLDGGIGNDDLHGGDGNDALAGGDGDDILDGAAGKDLLMGGAGADRFLLANDSAPDFLADLDASDLFVVPEGVEASALDFQRASDEFGNAGHLAILAGNTLLAVALDCPDNARPTIRLADGTTITSSAIDAALARHPTLIVPITLPSYRGIGSAAIDSMHSAGGASWLTGGDADDVLVGGASGDNLVGGPGADTLTGAAGVDTLDGGPGNDTLDAGTGADSLDGGDGDDRLVAGAGDDVVSGGTGNDTILGDAGADRITAGDGDDSIDGGAGGDTIDGGAGNDALAGGEGNDVLDGGAGNDTLAAGNGNDTLIGGAGDDLLDGGSGDDAFVLDGLGIDRVRDASGISTVRFGVGIAATSFTLTRGATGTADENSLVIDFGGGNRTVVEDGLRGGPARYEFADGTTLMRAELLDRRWTSSLALSGDVAHRQIAGGSGADALSAGTASSVDLRGGSGDDAITGSGFADLLSGDAGNDTLAGSAGNDSLDGGIGSDTLDAGAGIDALWGGAGDDTLAGGDGDDLAFGESGNDTFVSDKGSDVVLGGAGDDTYRFAIGAGYDIVVDADGANRVRFGAGIRASDVAFRTNGYDLVAALADGSRLLMRHSIAAPEAYAPTCIDAFDFDGETLTFAQASALATAFIDGDAIPSTTAIPEIGTDGNDVLWAGTAVAYGLAGDDTITGTGRVVGGPGDDTLEGAKTFVFGRGDGHDTVRVSNPSSKQTVATLSSWIELQPGIAPSDLAFGMDGRDLVVTIRDTGDTIRVADQFVRYGNYPTFNYPSAVAGIRFADGGTQGFDQVADAIGVGTDGDDRLGSVSVLFDDIRAGDGDDAVALHETQATVFGGDGNDTISADPHLPADRSRLHGEGGDDTLVASSANDARTELYGEDGDDRLVGHPGALLDGGAGDDRHELHGGASGGPIGVMFGRGGGRDSITFGEDESAGTRGLRFEVRVRSNDYRDLVVERDGDDLVLRIRDRDDRIAVPDFFAADAGRSGLTRLAVLQSGTDLVLSDSPDAESIAARAVDAPAATQQWTGSNAADIRVAAGGDDSLDGGGGNDELDGMSGDDALSGGAGDDVLFGRSGHDTIDGGDGADFLGGGRGDDILDGGAGADRIVDSHGDNVAEGGDGADVILLGGHRGLARGGAGDDSLSASSGSHLLMGDEGDDSLVAASGTVEIDGGAGDDSIRVAAEASAVVHFARGAGTDTVDPGGFREDAIGEIRLGAGIAASQIAIRRESGDLVLSVTDTGDSLRVQSGFSGDSTAVGRITFIDGGSLDRAAILTLARQGSALDDELVGTTGDDTLSGLGGDDTIDGRAGHDTIDGGAGADSVLGGTGNDLIDGGSGADSMSGGAGDDIYLVDDAGDTVVELPDEGTDEIRSSVSLAVPLGVERVRLTGTANVNAYGTAGNDDLAGNSGRNLLVGYGGADRLAGGAGDDTYSIGDNGDSIVELANEGVDTLQATFTTTLAANVENLQLVTSAAVDGTGNALDNLLTGGAGVNALSGLAGNDTLDGGAGADRLVGGAGNDTYAIDQSGDVIVELAGEGLDTVRASLSFVLPVDVENLVLTGTSAINATGNAAANQLTGNSGANILDGKAGADAMAGGKGNDTYVVDTAGDTVTELASEGIDLVQSSAAFVLGANVENLTLTGTGAIDATGNAVANVLTGNAAANTLDGGAGNDTLKGGAGDDTYVVDTAGDTITEIASEGTDTVRASVSWTLGNNIERLMLAGASSINATGNALSNTLAGNAANNVLDGKTGADTMAGGAGNDTYVVDAAGDTVAENAGEGTDLVQATLSWTLAANVENLTLTGTAAINGTGNPLTNALVGNAAANLLDGGAGNDTMRGGAGDDTYVVDAAGDAVIENAGEGTDLVKSAVTWTLGSNLENLSLTGTASVNATGNTLANVLTGNVAANMLSGGSGADTMRGGAGNDSYVVDASTDVVAENAAEGTDLVQSSVTWTLGTNVEDLSLTGSSLIDGTGNTLSNSLAGNAAANILSGADGNDLVWGAAGNDSLAGGNGNDVLQGGDGNDAIGDTAGNNLLDGGLGVDTLTGAAGREILIGGKGDDTIAAGTGADVFAFNKGDGKDTILASAGADDTLSLGGGLKYADLGLRKVGNDLVLDAGVDQVTLKDWYAAASNHRIAQLQVVTDASTDYLSTSTDATRNRRVARFDFAQVVAGFDAALAANPSLTRWTVADALAGAFVGGSDASALGGDLAYQFGHGGSLAGIGFDATSTILADANFGVAPQALLPSATLSAGPRLLR